MKLTSIIYNRFLLSALQIQVILQELTISKRKAKIQELPTDLYAAFRISLERIRALPGPARKLGMKVLMWTHLARRQLHLEEILHALAVEDGATDLDRDNIPLEETILHCCNGLVVIDHETSGVRLVHFSLQEFFKLHGAEFFPEGHKEISRTCLTYLNFMPLFVHCTKVEELTQLLENYHLLQYAAGQWEHHAFHQFDDTLKSLALRLLVLEKPPAAVQYCFWEWRRESDNVSYRSWKPQGYRDEISWCCKIKINDGLHVAAAFGLESIVEHLLTTSKRERLNRITPLSVKTPLKFAASRGHTNIVCLLLQQHDIDVNVQGTDYQTPLWAAVKRGYGGIVSLLLKHPNIDVNPSDRHMRTPLVHASWKGYEGIVRQLLEHPNIDVNASDQVQRRTSLYYCKRSLSKYLLGTRRCKYEY